MHVGFTKWLPEINRKDRYADKIGSEALPESQSRTRQVIYAQT
jgi:hypothetical protein